MGGGRVSIKNRISTSPEMSYTTWCFMSCQYLHFLAAVREPATVCKLTQKLLTHLDGKAENLNAHPAHVRSCYLPDQFSKLVPVLIDLLDSQGTCKRAPSLEHFCSWVYVKIERENFLKGV